MNIPEITNALRQEPSSESLAHARPAAKSHSRDGTESSSGTDMNAPQANTETSSSTISKDEMQALVKDVEKQLEKNDVSLKFNVLEENDTIQVEIVNGEGKTIRKIPDDDFLRLSKSLKNYDRGFLDKFF